MIEDPLAKEFNNELKFRADRYDKMKHFAAWFQSTVASALVIITDALLRKRYKKALRYIEDLQTGLTKVIKDIKKLI